MAGPKTIALNDGRSIPQLGFGVWRLPDEDAPQIVGEALRVGFRHIDTAQAYGNEAGVGRAIAESGVAREEIFLTSKLRSGHQGKDQPIESYAESVERLGLGPLDLFLIHWPAPKHDRYVDTWRALIGLQKDGKVHSIGVSNFTEEHLTRLADETGVVPAVNQVELHPYFQQKALRRFHAEHGIVTQSYSPLGSGEVLGDETIGEIARKHGRSPAQVIIRWHLQEGLVVLPKTATVSRVEENFSVFDFDLDDEDLEAIDGLDKPDGKILPPPEENNNLF